MTASSNDKIIEKYLREANQGHTKISNLCDRGIIKKMMQHIPKPFGEITSDDVLDYFKKAPAGKSKPL